MILMGWLAEKLWFWEERRNYADEKEKDEARRALIGHLAEWSAEDAQIADAVADERERCAQICEEYVEALDFSHSCDEFTAEALRDCATDIRKGEG